MFSVFLAREFGLQRRALLRLCRFQTQLHRMPRAWKYGCLHIQLFYLVVLGLTVDQLHEQFLGPDDTCLLTRYQILDNFFLMFPFEFLKLDLSDFPDSSLGRYDPLLQKLTLAF